jgi:hypothetical protein
MVYRLTHFGEQIEDMGKVVQESSFGDIIVERIFGPDGVTKTVVTGVGVGNT